MFANKALEWPLCCILYCKLKRSIVIGFFCRVLAKCLPYMFVQTDLKIFLDMECTEKIFFCQFWNTFLGLILVRPCTL